MSFAYATTLTLMEWLSLTGFAQSILIFVYIAFRARNWKHALLPLSYFLVLALAFALQLALRLEDFEGMIRLMQWVVWMQGPPLCVLIVAQLASAHGMPEKRDYQVLAFVPVAFILACVAREAFSICGGALACARFMDWLYWLGSMAGGLALLYLWHQKSFGVLWTAKDGRDRYWLAISFVSINLLVVVTELLRSSGDIADRDADVALVASGFGFVYLVSTVLFRIFPRPVALRSAPRFQSVHLNADEQAVAGRVRRLMEEDKLYQEPSFSRMTLARELKVSESMLSRVINASFGQSLPQMVQAYRVEDAKVMLRNPAISVQVAAEEAGFSSLATFNRVFRALTGKTPTEWRAEQGH